VQRMCDVVFDVVAVLQGRTPRFAAPAEPVVPDGQT